MVLIAAPRISRGRGPTSRTHSGPPLIRTGLEPTGRPRTACRGQAAGGRGGGAASRPFCFFIKAGLQVLGQEAGSEGQRTLGGASRRSGNRQGLSRPQERPPVPFRRPGEGEKARTVFPLPPNRSTSMTDAAGWTMPRAAHPPTDPSTGSWLAHPHRTRCRTQLDSEPFVFGIKDNHEVLESSFAGVRARSFH